LDLNKILLICCLGLSFAIGVVVGNIFKGAPTTPSYSTSPISLIVVGKPTFDGANTAVTHQFRGAPNQLYKIQYTTDLNSRWETGEDYYSTEDGVFDATLRTVGNQTNSWGKQMFFRLKDSI
jgi:hypothetical protein